jgi:hypothetical protein
MFSARNLLCATAFALTTAAASHASAAVEVYVSQVTEFGPGKVTVDTGGNFKNPDATALGITYNYGIGPGDPDFTAWGFCIDLFLGVAVPSQYHIAEASEVSSLFTASQQQQIYGLAALGSDLIKNGASDLANKLAGIQGAIWAIEYPTYTVTGGNASIQNYLTNYVAQAPSLTGNAYVLLSDNKSSQGFVIGVPEPATWAMMIVGFGAVGMVLRSRRRPVLAA